MPPKPRAKKRNQRHFLRTGAIVVFALGCLAGAISFFASACSGWDPLSPFERNSPEVDRAIEDLDAGRFESAAETLERYLGTGQCSDAGIGLPDAVRQKHDGAFDLGLVLFHLAERFGQRFGDEELSDGGPAEEQALANRSIEIDCALIIVQAIASDPKVPIELRARARYLAGNLEFLRKKYEEAVRHYDEALALIPGIYEEAGGDGIGRDAAWNRAIALRRIEDQKDAGNDAPDAEPDADSGDDGGPDSGDDGGDDGGPDSGDDGGPDSGDDGGPDSGDGGGSDAGDKEDGGGDHDAGGGQDAGNDASSASEDAGAKPPPPAPKPEPVRASPEQDDRILDRLEEAPTYQEQEAQNRAGSRRGRAMEDK